MAGVAKGDYRSGSAFERGFTLEATSGATCDALGKGGKASGGAGPCSFPVLSRVPGEMQLCSGTAGGSLLEALR